MEQSQADAIARAILEPDLKAQEQLRRKRAAESKQLTEKRKVAWLGLAGFAIGAVAAHFTGEGISAGGLWGGVAGAAVGWVINSWRNRRSAA